MTGGLFGRGAHQAVVNKITWQKAGGITEPGRYMFTFGWLTVTAEDLAVWQQFPDAMFTLVENRPCANQAGEFHPDEFHLGAFELPEHPSAPDSA
jgi:hypothetical protein